MRSSAFLAILLVSACAPAPVTDSPSDAAKWRLFSDCPVIDYQDELQRDGLEVRRCPLAGGDSLIMVTDPNISWPVLEMANGSLTSLEQAILDDPVPGFAWINPMLDRFLRLGDALIYTTQVDGLETTQYVVLKLDPPRYLGGFLNAEEAYERARD